MAVTIDGTNGITTPDLESTGPVIGTTGTFSGAVQASGVTTNLYPLVSGTAVASTSGTSIDFTGIPSWVKRITVMFSGVSTNGTSGWLVQVGDSGGIENTGYTSSAFIIATTGSNGVNSTAGYVVFFDNASYAFSGKMVLDNITSNTWVSSHTIGSGTSLTGLTGFGGGSKATSATLDRVRITTVNGTDTFDAGSINILWE